MCAGHISKGNLSFVGQFAYADAIDALDATKLLTYPSIPCGILGGLSLVIDLDVEFTELNTAHSACVEPIANLSFVVD
jgi:hypothetical protein